VSGVPYWQLAEASNGAVRLLLGHLETIKGLNHEITQQELSNALARSETAQFNISSTAEQFFGLRQYNGQTVSNFLLSRASNGTNMLSFVNSVLTYVTKYYPEVFQNEHVSKAAERLVTLASNTSDGLERAFYTAIVRPMQVIGSAVREAHKAKHQQ